ncbi:MAG: MarR family winged helix-turn-helix transcriptional regulator [Intestinibaculum porci]|uniref:MarR family winged helix-turn-helix transcriptional regulator n=1 Tax=Intestinibaculum porci TaxID=2487118 RepID=UPI003F0F86F4
MISHRERDIYVNARKMGRFLYFYTGDRSGQRRVLLKLQKHGEMTQRELQERLEIKSGSLSELLKKMEREELIEKRRSDSDGRVIYVRLTQKGSIYALQAIQEMDQFTERLFEVLDDQERNEFLRILEKLNVHFDELKDDEIFKNIERGKIHE